MWQCGTHSCAEDCSFVGECLGYFRLMCVLYGCVNAFRHQWLEDFLHKKPKICIHRFIQQTFNDHK